MSHKTTTTKLVIQCLKRYENGETITEVSRGEDVAESVLRRWIIKAGVLRTNPTLDWEFIIKKLDKPQSMVL